MKYGKKYYQKYDQLPEPDSSLPDNDLGSMVSAILVACALVGLLVWSLK